MSSTTPIASSTHASTRIRIHAINVDLTSPSDYPICLKLLLNEQPHQQLKEIAVNRPLRWNNVSPIDVKPNDYIELRIYEAHLLFRKVRIGTVGFRASQVDGTTTEIIASNNTGLAPCSVKFSFLLSETGLSAAHHAYQAAAEVVSRDASVLESMRKVRDLVGTVLKVGQQLSEMTAVSRGVFDLCTQALEALEKQNECDTLVADLVLGIGNMLPLVDAVKDRAKIAKLETTIIEILRLIEDASRYVIEYSSRSPSARAMRAFGRSALDEKVDQILENFKNLKEDFDRGMVAQIVERVEVMLDDADRQLLTSLVTPGASYDPAAGCLEGTRTTVLTDIRGWIDNSDTSQSLFWLSGLAGCGKSTVANSVCQQLDATGHLAGAFFCKRDSEHLSKPENIVSALAADLAFTFQPYRAKLVSVLRENPKLTNSTLGIRFQGMIVEPIRGMGDTGQVPQAVIVVDALDECGSVDTRAQLTACLLELSLLAPWLKVIVTSRPNEEIMRLFQKEGRTILRRDLFQEEKASVASDIMLFIRHRLAQLMDDDESLGPNNWLNDGTVGQLTARANGLFIWAQTVCNLIYHSLDPEQKVKEILSGKTSGDANKQLDSLYTSILYQALGGIIGSAHTIRSCVAAIVLTRIPLVDTTLGELVVGQISLTALRSVIRRLASVIYRDQDGSVRALHQSFTDYMMNEQCPNEYRIQRGDENLALSISCMSIMAEKLRFNICGLEDSKLFNYEITDLATRIQDNIPPHLEYSCIYWTSHLVAAPMLQRVSQERQSLTELLEKLLLGPRALYWIEVLSLLKRLDVIDVCLLELIDWLQDPSDEISVHAEELQRFVAVFFQPISQSTPHLYISALPTGSEQFDSIRKLKKHFPNVIEISRGKHLGKLSNQWLKVIRHPSWVRSVAYSPSGKLIATGSGKMVHLWDARTGAVAMNPFGGHSETVMSVAFAPDGNHIVSGSYDKTVRVWDIHTGAAAIDPLEGHSEQVNSVAFSPNGHRIASGSDDKTVRVWDPRLGTALLGPLEGHSEAVTCVVFSPDGQYIASGSEDETLRLWNAHTGATTRDPIKRNGGVNSVAFSPDGQQIVLGLSSFAIELWDLQSATSVKRIQGRTSMVMSVAVSPDGRLVVWGSFPHENINVWDLSSGTSLLAPLKGHSNNVCSVAFSPDGRFIVSGSYDNTARVWDIDDSIKVAKSLGGHSDIVQCVAISPDGKLLASGSDDNTVRVWNLRSGTAVFDPFEGHSGWVVSIAFSPDGVYVVSGSRDTTVRIWDLRTGSHARDPLTGHSQSVSSVAISPDGQHIISGSSDKTVRVWNLRTGSSVLSLLEGSSQGVVSVAVSPDGQYIISVSYDNTIRFWDLHSGVATLEPLALKGHTEWVTSVAFSPDGRYIASTSHDDVVQVWDLQTRPPVPEPLKGHTGRVTSVAFSPDSRCIVSGSLDGTVRVWDVHTGTVIFDPLTGHLGFVTCVAFSPDGQHVISGAFDNSVRVWDVSSSRIPILSLPREFVIAPSAADVSITQPDHTFFDEEGWVLREGKRPLLWLPKVYRRPLTDHSLLAISSNPLNHPVLFDLSKFKHGTEWALVHDSSLADP